MSDDSSDLQLSIWSAKGLFDKGVDPNAVFAFVSSFRPWLDPDAAPAAKGPALSAADARAAFLKAMGIGDEDAVSPSDPLRSFLDLATRLAEAKSIKGGREFISELRRWLSELGHWRRLAPSRFGEGSDLAREAEKFAADRRAATKTLACVHREAMHDEPAKYEWDRDDYESGRAEFENQGIGDTEDYDANCERRRIHVLRWNHALDDGTHVVFESRIDSWDKLNGGAGDITYFRKAFPQSCSVPQSSSGRSSDPLPVVLHFPNCRWLPAEARPPCLMAGDYDLRQAACPEKKPEIEHLPAPELPAIEAASRIHQHEGDRYLLPEHIVFGPPSFDPEPPGTERIPPMDIKSRVADGGQHILVLGGTGTGKESLASYIARESKYGLAKYRTFNCSGLGDNTVRDELFGHIEGAFTGAIAEREGLLKEEGILFMDEFAEITAETQAHLLRFMEDKKGLKLGSDTPETYHACIIAGTNKGIAELKQDLVYRFGCILRLPCLRERMRDMIWMLPERMYLGEGNVSRVSLRFLCYLFSLRWAKSPEEENFRVLSKLCIIRKKKMFPDRICDISENDGFAAQDWADFAGHCLGAWESMDPDGPANDPAKAATARLLLAIRGSGCSPFDEPLTFELDGLQKHFDDRVFLLKDMCEALGADGDAYAGNPTRDKYSEHGDAVDLGTALAVLARLQQAFSLASPRKPGAEFLNNVRSLALTDWPFLGDHVQDEGESDLRRKIRSNNIPARDEEILVLSYHGNSNPKIAEILRGRGTLGELTKQKIQGIIYKHRKIPEIAALWKLQSGGRPTDKKPITQTDPEK